MNAFRYLQRLDCPSALTWPTWLVAFAPSVTTAVLHDRNLYGGSAGLWLLSAIVGALAAGLVLWIAATVLRGRHPLGVLLAVFLIAGVARGFGVGWTADLFALVPEPQFEVRAISGAILAVFWLSIATLIVQGFRTHRATRMELKQLERGAEHELRVAATELAQIKARTDSDVVSRIRQVAGTLRSGSWTESSAPELTRMADDLHTMSASIVRPLSHEVALAVDEPTEGPRPSRARAYLTILVDAITVDPFRPLWLMALLFPSILMTALRNYGPAWGVLGAAWIVVMAALVLTLARRVVQPLLRLWPVPVRALAVVLVWVTAGFAAALPVALSSAWGLGPERAWAVFGVPLLAYVPTTCLGLAIAAAISLSWALDEDTRQARIATLHWQTQVTRQGIWAERMRLGRFLHGSVQATLTSTALQIETSLARGQACDAIASTAAAHLAHLAEEMDRREMQATSAVDVSAVLGQIASVWSRVAEITCEVSPAAQEACSADPDAAEKVVEIVREAITNSVRHGRATVIAVGISRGSNGSLGIEVRDDGTAGAGGQAGFGSAMLDDMCLEWSRERDDGTVLLCRVATYAGRVDQPV